MTKAVQKATRANPSIFQNSPGFPEEPEETTGSAGISRIASGISSVTPSAKVWACFGRLEFFNGLTPDIHESLDFIR
jgi:hypothetical protein